MPGCDSSPDERLVGLDTSPTVLRPESGRTAVLGRHALDKPGDCKLPDDRYLAAHGADVNTAQKRLLDRRQRVL